MQAWALAKAVEGCGERVEIIDFRYSSRSAAYQNKSFLDDLRQEVSVSRTFVDDLDSTFKFCKEKYDLVLVGSDEVLKFDYSNGVPRNNPYCTPIPNVFYQIAKHVPSVMVAPSVGSGMLASLTNHQKAELRECLTHFKVLSARDTKTQEFFKALGFENVSLIPDPTFSIEFEKLTEWKINAAKKLKMAGFARGSQILLEEFGLKTLINSESFSFNLLYLWIMTKFFGRRTIRSAQLHFLEWLFAPSFFSRIHTGLMHGYIVSILNGCDVISVDRRVKSIELKQCFTSMSKDQRVAEILRRRRMFREFICSSIREGVSR